MRLDFATGEYVAGGKKADEIVARMLKKARKPTASSCCAKVHQPAGPVPLEHPARQRSTTCAVHLDTVADTAREIDFAMRWGFGSAAGPVRAVASRRLERRWRTWIAEDIACGQDPLQRPAARLGDRAARWPPKGGVHTPEGSWSAAESQFKPRSNAAGLRPPAVPRVACSAVDAADPLKSGHRTLQERRDPRLDARRRGGHCLHHRQAAPDLADW